MNKIVRKEQFSEKVFLFEIEAPLIAKSRKAGNFVIVRIGVDHCRCRHCQRHHHTRRTASRSIIEKALHAQ